MPPKRPSPTNVERPSQAAGANPDSHQDDSEEVRRNLARWTDEQETALLKGVVRWKPVGMHKHFRIIAIHDYMFGQGVVRSSDEHTSIPGLWMKLNSLYNLPVLDEREDSIMQSSSDENGSPGEMYSPYDLPDSECGALKFDKRINLEGSKSPALLNSRGESTILDTDEPASSPAPARRGARTTRRAGRVSKVQQEIGSSQRTSKAASATEDEPMPDTAEDDGENEEGSDDGEDNDNEGVDDLPKTRTTRRGRRAVAAKGGRGRGGSKGRGRRK